MKKMSQISKPILACLAIFIGISCIAMAAVVSPVVSVTNNAVTAAGSIGLESISTASNGGDRPNLPTSGTAVVGVTYDLGVNVTGAATLSSILHFNVTEGTGFAAAAASDYTIMYLYGSTWTASVGGHLGDAMPLTNGAYFLTSLLVTYNVASVDNYQINFWLENA